MTDESYEKIETPKPGLEIATTGDGRDITRPYVAGMMLPNDRVLSGRGGGDLQIYEQVLSDPQVKACLEQRRNAVTSCEWVVEPASDRRADRKAADWLRDNLHHIGWDQRTDRMLYASFYGFSAAELLWEVRDGKLAWKAIKVRNRRRFAFNSAGELRLRTPQNMIEGEAAKAPYFWHIATGADNDDEPYGLGLAHWCYWPTLFKRHGIGFWLTFQEKYGMPTGIGEFPVGATPAERAMLLGAIRAIRSSSGVILPQGMKIDLLEAKRSGSVDYKALHDTMDEAIAKAIVGQTMTTDNGSSQAQAKVHMEVRQDIVKADADLVCESFNLGPVRWLTMFNFDGADPPRVFRAIEEPEDLDKIADRDGKVIKWGFKPSLDYVQRQYGDHWEPAASPPAESQAPLAPPAEFAAGDTIARGRAAAQERLDVVFAAADALASDAQDYVQARVRELQVILDETGDLAEFAARLNELADDDPDGDFVESLARAGFGAWLEGYARREA
jgi:phage gp29-like protein